MGENAAGAGLDRGSQECVSLGAALWSGTGKALSCLSETDEPLLPDGRDIYQSKGERPVLVSNGGFHGADHCFLLTAKRDKASAQRFFHKALHDSVNVLPRVINVDKNAAYPAAFRELQAEGVLSRHCRLRQCEFLNHVVEQDHRTLKRRVKLAMAMVRFTPLGAPSRASKPCT